MERVADVTQDRLKELFYYNPSSGAFTRLITVSNNAKAGDIAGCINVHGYKVIRVDGKLYRTNRLAVVYMTGKWPVADVDHKDRDTLNDQWVNLREATASQNLANAKIRSDNTSGFKGVTWFKDRNKWMAKICVNGKSKTLGYADTATEAAKMYEQASQKYFGEFARAG